MLGFTKYPPFSIFSFSTHKKGKQKKRLWYCCLEWVEQNKYKQKKKKRMNSVEDVDHAQMGVHPQPEKILSKKNREFGSIFNLLFQQKKTQKTSNRTFHTNEKKGFLVCTSGDPHSNGGEGGAVCTSCVLCAHPPFSHSSNNRTILQCNAGKSQRKDRPCVRPAQAWLRCDGKVLPSS